MIEFHGTTIVAVRKEGQVAMAGDGQVTMQESTVMKHGARKVRRMYDGQVLAGFAGSVADAMTLFDKFEGHLNSRGGNLPKAAVELAKEWRTDRMLRRLEAILLVADKENLLLVAGSGEVIEPDDDVLATGSGGNFAVAAARALVKHSNLTAREIAEEAMRIAASLCVYTNDHITVEVLQREMNDD